MDFKSAAFLKKIVNVLTAASILQDTKSNGLLRCNSSITFANVEQSIILKIFHRGRTHYTKGLYECSNICVSHCILMSDSVHPVLCRCSDNLEHLPAGVEHTKVGSVYKSMQIHHVPCFTVTPKYREEG